MVRDRVCDMKIDEGQARHKALHKGKNYFFCNEDCKVKFENNPEKYSDTVDNEVSKTRKVVVIGAGQVGATICFALTMSGLASTIVKNRGQGRERCCRRFEEPDDWVGTTDGNPTSGDF